MKTLGPLKPIVLAHSSDNLEVVGVVVPHGPHIPADLDFAGYDVRSSADRRDHYPCRTPEEAARRLVLAGVETHLIYAVARTDDVEWSAVWDTTRRTWGAWRIS